MNFNSGMEKLNPSSTYSSCATILVIEDDVPIRDTIRWSLEAEGYSVLVAGDGKAGLDLLKQAKAPCLILLDLMLPIMNGWEFLAELRRQPSTMLAAIPVLVTSAAGDRESASAVRQAEGYMKKPIDLELLLKFVAKFCTGQSHSIES